MASFLKNALVSTAVHKGKNKFDLSGNTLTTQNFFRLKPVFYQEMRPNEKLNVSVSSFCRLLPQNKPIMGSGRIVNRCFFVPYNILFKGFDNFRTQVLYTNSSGQRYRINSAPWFSMNTLLTFFVENSTELDHAADFNDLQVSSYDFAFWNSTTGFYEARLFNDVGKHAYDLLRCLGLNLITKSEFVSDPDYKKIRLQCLKLLAFAKIWTDWYSNSAYDNYATLDAIFNREPDSQGIELSYSDLETIFNLVYLVDYDSDYFTSQWDNPNGPNNLNSLGSNVDISDTSVHHSTQTQQNAQYGFSQVVMSDNDGQPIALGNYGPTPYNMTNHPTTPAYLSQYILDSLKRVTDFVHRKQLAGNRLIDNFLAQFGLVNQKENLNRSVLCGSFDVPLRFGEVTATTENASAAQPLGDMAGRAVGYTEQSKRFSFDTSKERKCDGIFMILSYIEPRIGYVEGIDRSNFALSPLDFYNADFDHLGTQATFLAELFSGNPKNPMWQETSAYDGIFGWLPRYAHLKVGHDIMSGDFARPLYKDSMSCWHMFRLIEPYVNLNDDIPEHSKAFCVGDSEQYQRIFAFQDSSSDSGTDQFLSAYHFDVQLFSPMSKLWNNYEFENEDEHKQVKMKINGSDVN